MPRLDEIKSLLRQKTQEIEKNFFVYLPNLNDWQKQEIAFHDKIFLSEEEAHQLKSYRNRHYHGWFIKKLRALPQGSIILEIGTGIGNDLLPLLGRGLRLIASDISLESLKYARQRVNEFSDEEITYVQADGRYLPFENNSLDAVFMVASLHHFENEQEALAEFYRVLKPGGLLIFGMEPAGFMMKFTKLFSGFASLRVHQGKSIADEHHHGYGKSDFIKLAGNNFQIQKIKKVWLLQGFVHYGLEGCFRLFKLNRRLKLPLILEWLLLVTDEILLKIPILNILNWHWIAILTKR